MPIAIKRDAPEPLYLQVKDQIERLIRMGIWSGGYKLPTERELANKLGISRNTVSAAYQQLESDGFLIARQGSGTFVADEFHGSGAAEQRLMQMIDLLFDQAVAMGVSPAEVAELIQTQARQREQMQAQFNLAFIECNREQLDYFAHELQLGSGVRIRRILLDDLRRHPETLRNELREYDLVVTTLFHRDEVAEFLDDNDVLGIALDPDMETIVRIARVQTGSRVGLVCISREFAERVRKSLSGAGIDSLDLLVTTTQDPDQIRQFCSSVDLVIASPGRRREVERLLPGSDVIEFIYRPDAGSVNLLRSVLVERSRGVALET